jgi:hypothetical protein
MKNIENQVAWFLAELCKKTSEISAGQSVFRRCLTPRVLTLFPHFAIGGGFRDLKKALCSR